MARNTGSGSQGPGCVASGMPPTFPGLASPTYKTGTHKGAVAKCFLQCQHGRALHAPAGVNVRKCARVHPGIVLLLQTASETKRAPVSDTQHCPERAMAQGHLKVAGPLELHPQPRGQGGEARASGQQVKSVLVPRPQGPLIGLLCAPLAGPASCCLWGSLPPEGKPVAF